ncbi:MAG: cadmium-translocating P-type ATPase [Bdellovibrionales bacterium]|nr:cadmium-translocating P-type ATPase [Bdellovibrionales bacterium]
MKEETLRTTEFKIEGLDCPEESKLIENRLKNFQGVRSITPNFVQGKVKIVHENDIDSKLLASEIEATGLRVLTDKVESGEESSKRDLNRVLGLVGSSGALLTLGLIVRWAGAPANISTLLFVGSILLGGALIAPKAFRAILSRTLDMNVLMTAAVTGAAVIGEWAEAAAVVFLFSFSEYLERFSIARARKAVDSLLNLTPPVALVKDDSGFTEKPVSEVKVGDLIQVRAGDRIPIDGTVTQGASSVDQSPITGESVPVEKNRGDAVFAGTINGEGALEIVATKAASDSALAGIVRLVEDAQGERAPAQRFVDRFAAVYTPAVFILAVGMLVIMPTFFGGAWSIWLYRSLVLLVIACPCALVISTPVSMVSGLTAMAKKGVLVKGGTHLEALGKIRALAVDKTGTITEGKPKVTGVFPMNGKSENEILTIAASLDASSNHPLAEAVMKYADEKNVQYVEAANMKAISGMGVRGQIDGHDYFLGNHHFVEKLGICSKELEALLSEIEASAQSVIVVGHAPHGAGDEEVLGVLSVADTVRKESKAALAAIHSAGIKAVVMLSGDNTRTAGVIASQVGIDDARGNLLPEDKINAVRDLVKQYRYVAMIGDGVNDAPAMAAATVGIAMGSVGTDTAIEVADVTLMNDDLSKVAEAILTGRRTLRVIQFNIGFALIVKFAFLGLALMGISSLWLAILADTGATLLVIANALRLLRS